VTANTTRFPRTCRMREQLQPAEPLPTPHLSVPEPITHIANLQGDPVARYRFAEPHTMSGPSRSMLGFAPKCSTRLLQLFPRK
jgi:hypothetical protein